MRPIVRQALLGGLGVLVVACGKSPSGAKDASSTEVPAFVGKSACLGKVTGTRYPLEEALEAHDMSLIDACPAADIEVEESGEAGAYKLRYRWTAQDKWQACESTESDRRQFIRDCTEEMLDGLEDSAESEPPEGAGGAGEGGGAA
jgi:hypothetical protein